jgi:hypothetical protein
MGADQNRGLTSIGASMPTELAIAAEVLNRMLELGRPE